jgi:broad specificity phosphatase PhoE
VAHPPRRRPLIPAGLDATLVLVRHGESRWILEGRFQGQGDSALTGLGRRQAAAVAGRIAHPDRAPLLPIPFDPPIAVVHSPLARTTETARAIADALMAAGRPARLGTRPDGGLLEIGQGDWEGLTGAEIGERWPEVIAGWRHEPLGTWAPGGESLATVDARVRNALASVLGELAEGRLPGSLNRSQVLGYRDPDAEEPWAVLVGHDGVFKVVLLALLDLPLERFWAFPFALAGITLVEVRGGRGRLRAHNLVEHLSGLDGDEEEPARPSGAL